MWYSYAFNQDWDKIERPSSLFNNDGSIDESLKPLFQLVYNLKNIPQNPLHHPEGDAFVHTMQVADAAATIAKRENLNPQDKNILILSAILHDVGKAATTAIKLPNGEQIPYDQYQEEIHGPGSIIAYGHDEALVEDIENMLQQISMDDTVRNKIKTLITLHMQPHHLVRKPESANPKSLRKLKKSLEEVGLDPSMLKYLNEADLVRVGDYPEENQLLFNRINEIQPIPQKPPNIIAGNIIDNMIQSVFGDKKYEPRLIGYLVNIANKMHEDGYGINEIEINIKNIIFDKYNELNGE